jgi:hypothetical protein
LQTAAGIFALAACFLISVLSVRAFSQEQDLPGESAAPPASFHTLRLQDFEGLALAAVRQEFPRLPGFFASSHSCRLPDYGPLISITIQPPTYIFTRPVLLELERRQKIAEEQARRIRVQIDQAAQIITLKAREAALTDEVTTARARKKNKDLQSLEKELENLRQTISELEANRSHQQDSISISVEDSIPEVDLNKMIMANYQQLIQRVTGAMKDTLAENGARIADLNDNERVCITAYIRDGFLNAQEKNIILILNPSDIRAFRSGQIDLNALKQRIVVRDEKK